jgi:hypothetical protein
MWHIKSAALSGRTSIKLCRCPMYSPPTKTVQGNSGEATHCLVKSVASAEFVIWLVNGKAGYVRSDRSTHFEV